MFGISFSFERKVEEVAHMRDTRYKIRHALSYSRFVSSDPSKNANALQSAHCYGPVVLNSRLATQAVSMLFHQPFLIPWF